MFLFSKISATLTPRTMTFGHKDYFYTKRWHPKNVRKMSFLGHFSGVFFIHKFKNDVFVHNFLSHQTSELPEIWNLSKHWTNLKNNEDRISKFAFLPFFTAIFRSFCRFVVFYESSTFSPYGTMTCR